MLDITARERMNLGRIAYHEKRFKHAYRYFEEAHILGQRLTKLHVLSHWWLLKTAWQCRDRREVIGQIPRIFAALAFSRVWVPVGNTGRANVSAFASMAIPNHLKVFFEDAR